MRTYKVLLALALIISMCGCKQKDQIDNVEMFADDKLVAWCIVPFDASERTPLERAEMMNELGLTKLAYDYRDKHIPSFKSEIEVLKEHHIELIAVWLWLEPKGDDILGDAGRAIMETLDKLRSQLQ